MMPTNERPMDLRARRAVHRSGARAVECVAAEVVVAELDRHVGVEAHAGAHGVDGVLVVDLRVVEPREVRARGVEVAGSGTRADVPVRLEPLLELRVSRRREYRGGEDCD
jgi:hypothetical protein